MNELIDCIQKSTKNIVSRNNLIKGKKAERISMGKKLQLGTQGLSASASGHGRFIS